ncbi:unnamed protein product [Calypogeia fissa]
MGNNQYRLAFKTLLMRHESDSKDNTYWLGLLTHLQAPSVDKKDVGCIRDLPYLYEVATADDIYNAHNHLCLDDDSLFTCIGVAGTEAKKGIPVVEVEEDTGVDAFASIQLHGRGMSTMTRATT